MNTKNKRFTTMCKVTMASILAGALLAVPAAAAGSEIRPNPKVVERITVFSQQDDWDSTYIDAHEPGYGIGDQHIVNFSFYSSLAGLKANKKPLGTTFIESTLLSSGEALAGKDVWASNGYDLFKDGRIDTTSLYVNTLGGPTPEGTKSHYTITGGTGKYFGARGTVIVERMGEGESRYLKSTFKISF